MTNAIKTLLLRNSNIYTGIFASIYIFLNVFLSVIILFAIRAQVRKDCLKFNTILRIFLPVQPNSNATVDQKSISNLIIKQGGFAMLFSDKNCAMCCRTTEF